MNRKDDPSAKTNRVLGVLVTAHERVALEKLARAECSTLSSVMRRAFLAYLDRRQSEEKTAA
jgi:predicted transcriptional regulator